MKKLLPIILIVILASVLFPRAKEEKGPAVVYAAPIYVTAEEINIRFERLYQNVGKLIDRNLHIPHRLVDGMEVNQALKEIIVNLETLNDLVEDK